MSSKRGTSRNRDPFAVDPLPKAHYYPSPERRLDREQKATAIKTTGEVSADDEIDQQLNQDDELFLNGANSYQLQRAGLLRDDDDDDDDFDESWPCSERPSATSLPDVEDSVLDIDKYLQLGRDKDKLPERIRMPGSYTAGPISANKQTGKPIKSRIPVPENRLSQNGVNNDEGKQDEDLNTSEQDGSVLQRYVDRFRNSKPMSRDEREKIAAPSNDDFWWLSNGPPQVPSKHKPEKDKPAVSGSSRSSALTQENLHRYHQLQHQAEYVRVHGVPDSPGDKRTIELQERADKLLERSSSTVLSTEPAVSTEGLGSNTSGMSSLEEYSHKPTFAQYLERETPAKYQSLVPPPLPGQRGPSESDPLYQWRLRRRMELAQQSAPKQTPQFDFLNKSDQQKKTDSKLDEFKQQLSGRVPAKSQVQFTPNPAVEKTAFNTCHREQTSDQTSSWQPQIASPSLHRHKPRSESQSDVDPHLHLMCDLLPCPHSGQIVELGTNYRSQPGTSAKIDNSVDNSEKGDKCVGEYKQYLEAEKPDVDKSKQKSSSSEMKTDNTGNCNLAEKRIQSIEDIERMVKNIGRNNADEVAMETRDVVNDNNGGKSQEHSDKSGSNSARSVKSCRSDKQNKINESEPQSVSASNQDFKPKKDSSIQPKHSSSPKSGRKGVNAAIGQVIKEHLFRTSTSTVISSVDSLPPSASTERLPWKQKSESHDVKLHEIADESCESDGEFDDDNLLQMLRKQRATYELQLKHIDEMLLRMDR